MKLKLPFGGTNSTKLKLTITDAREKKVIGKSSYVIDRAAYDQKYASYEEMLNIPGNRAQKRIFLSKDFEAFSDNDSSSYERQRKGPFVDGNGKLNQAQENFIKDIFENNNATILLSYIRPEEDSQHLIGDSKSVKFSFGSGESTHTTDAYQLDDLRNDQTREFLLQLAFYHDREEITNAIIMSHDGNKSGIKQIPQKFVDYLQSSQAPELKKIDTGHTNGRTDGHINGHTNKHFSVASNNHNDTELRERKRSTTNNAQPKEHRKAPEHKDQKTKSSKYRPLKRRKHRRRRRKSTEPSYAHPAKNWEERYTYTIRGEKTHGISRTPETPNKKAAQRDQKVQPMKTFVDAYKEWLKESTRPYGAIR